MDTRKIRVGGARLSFDGVDVELDGVTIDDCQIISFDLPAMTKPVTINLSRDRRPVGLNRYQRRRQRSLERRISRDGYSHIPE